MLETEYGNAMRKWREELGNTQEQMAEMAGCSKSVWATRERGELEPEERIRRTMRGRLGVEEEERLFRLQAAMEKPPKKLKRKKPQVIVCAAFEGIAGCGDKCCGFCKDREDCEFGCKNDPEKCGCAYEKIWGRGKEKK